ncbi:MAG: hypothetical protein WCB67_05900 [Solirubrobacteraceae bacterium]
MSFLRGGGQAFGGDGGLDPGVVSAEIEERRAARSDRLCTGTLACPECDAPVAIGGQPRSLADWLTCPFCQHSGRVRDFLSLASPTRPTRVVVRVSAPLRRSAPARRA